MSLFSRNSDPFNSPFFRNNSGFGGGFGGGGIFKQAMSFKPFKYMFMLVMTGFALVAGSSAYYQMQPPETVRATVTDKGSTVSGDKDGVASKYLIYTDKGTFENVNSVLSHKFNSDEIQGSITRGQQYDITVKGFRSQPFGVYQNVLTVTPVTPGK